MSSQKNLSIKLKRHVLLKNRTSFRIGGLAAYWFEPKDKNQLIRFLHGSRPSCPVFVIGAGSNLLIKEGVIPKIFIHLSAPFFNKIRVAGTRVNVGAGVKISKLISFLRSKNIGGYEFLAGIPGTMGGAVMMNAGARMAFDAKDSYREMKDIVDSVDVLDQQGRSHTYRKKDLKFSYRASSLKPFIITNVCLRLSRTESCLVRRRIKENLKKRVRVQDWRYASAGSFFKNPSETKPAGLLIDRCGCKGLRVGDAHVSTQHANFLINVNNAKSTDVIKLMEIIRKRVYNRFKIKLNPEVEFVS